MNLILLTTKNLRSLSQYVLPILVFIFCTMGTQAAYATCHNVTYGGKIGDTEIQIGNYNPSPIISIEDPSGGNGTLEFLWLQTTDLTIARENWTPISGANSSTFDPGQISETTYFLRCSRRDGCTNWDGESNIIAKVVHPTPTADCINSTRVNDLANAPEIIGNHGVDHANNLLNAIDGQAARFYDENDNIVIKLEKAIDAGNFYTISWKQRNYTSTISNKAKLIVTESLNGTDFRDQKHQTTVIKDFFIYTTFQSTRTTRFIKLKSSAGFADLEIDAITYNKFTCVAGCVNVTDPGVIVGDEAQCGAYDATPIQSAQAPVGGIGDLEYLWLSSTTGRPRFITDTIAGANDATYDPGVLTETTYFVRCSRRTSCDSVDDWIESNTIIKYVYDNCVNGPTVCELNDHGISDKTPGATRNVWMNFDDEGIKEYTVINNSSKIQQFEDGTAVITGTVARVDDPCFQYTYFVRLVNKSTWAQWAAQGKTFKPNGSVDHTVWTYYDVDDAKSNFIGQGCHAGEVLNISQNPTDRTLGFQIGDGANVKNQNFGLSGWYKFSGSRVGHGDYNSNIDNCVVPCTGKISSVFLTNGTDAITLENGGTYRLCDLPLDNYLEAEVSGDHESFLWTVNSTDRIENVLPYNFPATSNGDFWNPVAGQYRITGSLYSENHAGGQLCDQVDITINIITCPKVCVLDNHGPSGVDSSKDRLIWLKENGGQREEYGVVDNSSKFTEFSDGTALLTGTVAKVDEPCKKYTYSVRLINKSTWTQWEAQGKTFKPNGNADHTSWIYYDLDDANSTFRGIECLDGEILNISQNPADRTVGFQLGDAANLKNSNFGLSGWFFFEGSRTGKGDYNGNINDCELASPFFNIGNKVWEDLNGNGQLDDGEPGLENIRVQLIGTDFVGNGVILETVTDSLGMYLFPSLQPGTYKLIFGPPTPGFFATAKNLGDDNTDSDINSGNGMTDLKTYGGGENDLTIDAGYFRLAEIGNFVFEDLNGDGIRQGNENGIGGVEVILEGVDGENNPVNRTTISNDLGIYFFNGLKPGTYKLTFGEVDGFEYSANNQGGDDSADSNVDPMTRMTGMEELTSGEMNDTYDAGLFQPISLSGFVFIDEDNSGLRDMDDTPQSGVKVNLLRRNPINGLFSVVDMTMTSDAGLYEFTNQAPGIYQIQFDPNTLPIDFFFTTQQDVFGNSEDDIDSDVNANGVIEGIALTSGQAPVTNLGALLVNDAILPVEWGIFTAELVNKNEVQLFWTTHSEINNNYFQIERSIDGVNFEVIGFVEGYGTTDINNEYDYLDTDPFFGKNYYRLKQVDLDGAYEYSVVRTIVLQVENLPDVIVYPNPTKDFTTLRAVKPFETDVEVDIVSVKGEVLRTIQLSQSTNSERIDLREYQSGYYYLNIRYDEFRQVVHRVLKLQD